MSFIGQLQNELAEFKKEGVYKRLNYLDSPQDPRVKMEGRGEVVILSSNNYLGLCDVPAVVQAGKDALERWGAGTASVRFICGTFTIHRELETALAKFVGCESALTYVSCWNANEGLCPTVLSEPDLVISDQLNHASIIDSIRLAKAITKCQTAVYKHSDMKDLEEKLRGAEKARRKLIFTDGIFSMEGDIAKLPDLAALARKYDAVLAVDDSHATGVLGTEGRGTAEYYDMLGDIDIITSTPPVLRRLPTISRSAPGRSSSAMPFHRPWPRARSPPCATSKRIPSWSRSSTRTRATSASSYCPSASSRWRGRRRSCP